MDELIGRASLVMDFNWETLVIKKSTLHLRLPGNVLQLAELSAYFPTSRGHKLGSLAVIRILGPYEFDLPLKDPAAKIPPGREIAPILREAGIGKFIFVTIGPFYKHETDPWKTF